MTAKKVGQTDSRRTEFLKEKGQSGSCKGRVTAQKVRLTAEVPSFYRRKDRVTAVREECLQKKGQSDSGKGKIISINGHSGGS